MPGLQTVTESPCPRYLENVKEVPVPVKLQFSGNIPSWLRGTLLNSSPGLFDLEKGSVNFFLDGYAILSKFEINGNSLTFSSKYLQSTSYKKAIKAQKPVTPECGTPPGEDSSRGFFSKLLPAFTPNDVTDNCVLQMIEIGSSIYATGDTPYMHRIDLKTLDTLDTFTCAKALGVNNYCPRPVQDHNGDVYIMGAIINPTFRYTVLKMPAKNHDLKLEKKFETLCSFPSRWKFGATGLRNSFALTDNYIVFVEVPTVINIMKVAATYIRGYATIDWVDWRPEDKTRFCIINKHTGSVINTEMYADFSFINSEFLNAYEDGDQLIVDIFTLNNLSIFRAHTINLIRNQKIVEDYSPGEYHRFVLPIISDIKSVPEGKSLVSPVIKNNLVSADAKRVGSHIILSSERIREKDTGFEAGVINPNFMGKKHTFAYTTHTIASSLIPCSLVDRICKVDVDRRQFTAFDLKPDQSATYVTFVPDPNGHGEEDGVLISLVKSKYSSEERDFMIIIDPRSMTEIGRAEFTCPVSIGFRLAFIKS